VPASVKATACRPPHLPMPCSRSWIRVTTTRCRGAAVAMDLPAPLCTGGIPGRAFYLCGLVVPRGGIERGRGEGSGTAGRRGRGHRSSPGSWTAAEWGKGKVGGAGRGVGQDGVDLDEWVLFGTSGWDFVSRAVAQFHNFCRARQNSARDRIVGSFFSVG
jgi:hypothetical protein